MLEGSDVNYTLGTENDRLIIEADLDFFYGQVEQVMNPELKDIPFGIRQKALLVTCNYHARALGVQKMTPVRQALRVYPKLVIINGEDLTPYRRESRKIFELVRGICGNKVERLGLDELFMDVTEMIDEHMEHECNSARCFFRVKSKMDANFKIDEGFYHEPGSWAGHYYTKDGIFTYSEFENEIHRSPQLDRLMLASHLASFIRKMIYEKLGYTVSAGISTSKLLAKLMASVRKPNLQTLLDPDPTLRRDYMATVGIHDINGFGYKTLQIMGEQLQSSSPSTSTTVEQSMIVPIDPHTPVGEILPKLSRAKMISWYGPEKGERLWMLLHGVDTSPVIPTPQFPQQLSVEDSFRRCADFSACLEKLVPLTVDLIERLDGELVEYDTENGRGQWLRYPRTFRLSVRANVNGFNLPWGGVEETWYMDKRHSKSSPMPVEVFDLRRGKEERAKILVETTAASLLKRLVDFSRPFDFILFNVAATNLSTTMPSNPIADFLSNFPADIAPSTNQRKPPKLPEHEYQEFDPASIDPAVLLELPEDIRKELLEHQRQQRKSDGSNSGESIPLQKPMPLTKNKNSFDREAKKQKIGCKEERGRKVWECKICGVEMPLWVREAHEIYHRFKEEER
ncbi:uncharacterized protein VTP21DRAFT_6779 [Calcarisporiella thermophila]|uniref:uncharacterized protein n=1 Tax=Calcarisporiella thermophila TaxID=911321 RepID=UPI00374262F6